ncbi:MAG: hypothetical protein RLZZ330_147 [Actinomycetota bacterium]|jgi:alpha-galactosidase
MADFNVIARIPVDFETAEIYEEGWQSWSPTTIYKLDQKPFRPHFPNQYVMGYRADSVAPRDAFRGEGLLALKPNSETVVHVFSASSPEEIPSIDARFADGEIVITADGDISHTTYNCGSIPAALEIWGSDFAKKFGPKEIRKSPKVWCSWYQYFTEVKQSDIEENLQQMQVLDLPFDVVQIDDGYQSEIGDWLTYSDRFNSLSEICQIIKDAGREPGIWVAPFLVGENSNTAKEHPDWLVPGINAGRNWNQELYILDTTNPDAAKHLFNVFRTMRNMGITYFKIDFIYAGAQNGKRFEDISTIAAYRRGLEIIREAIGDAYLVGCGAPLLATVGLVDAVRVSPDIGLEYEPGDENLNEPSQRAAFMTGNSRRWMNHKFWINDPDCFIARPDVERREEWVEYCFDYDGLISTSDRLLDLDEWGLAKTREFLM